MKTNWNELLPDLNWVDGIGFCKQMDVNSLAYVDDEGNLKTDIVLREWDYIQDDKIYINSGQIVLNGDTLLKGTDGYYYVDAHDMKRLNNYIGEMICDTLSISEHRLSTIDGITGYGNNDTYPGENWIYLIQQNKTKEEVKTFLRDNPTTIVYQLAKPKVYDLVSPINLSSYEGRTVVDCNLKLPPIMSFTITSYISELVKTNRNRVSKVTNSISQYIETTLNHSDRLKKLEER